jgi:surface antigen
VGISSKFLIIGSALVLAAPPVAAQFGGISIPRIPSGSDSASKGSTDTGCKSPKKKKGAAMFGDIVGRVAGDQISRTGAGRFLPVSEFSSTITEAIACRLDPEEQAQAAQATDEALRTGEVGETAEWTSGTRENVTGKSTVKAQAAGGGGAKCMMVSDVIIVDGEETRAEKKMCRAPGQSRYVLTA